MVLNSQLKIPEFQELLKLCRNRDQWSTKTPLQMWCCLYAIGQTSFTYLGFTIFKTDQTLGWTILIPAMFTAMYTVFAIYTTFYYSINDELLKILPCTWCLVGPIYSVYILLCSRFFYDYNKTMVHLILDHATIFQCNIEKSRELA